MLPIRGDFGNRGWSAAIHPTVTRTRYGASVRRGAWGWTLGAALVAAVVFAGHGSLQWMSAIDFWAPCYADGFESTGCLHQQYEAVMPWWQRWLWMWPVEMAVAVLVVVTVWFSKVAPYLAWTALVLVGLSNVITDYMMGPVINGGYTSADSAPGVGYFGATMLCLAALLYLALAVRAVIVRSRPAEQFAIAERDDAEETVV